MSRWDALRLCVGQLRTPGNLAFGSRSDYVKNSPPSHIVLPLRVLRRGVHFSRYPIPGKWHHGPE